MRFRLLLCWILAGSTAMTELALARPETPVPVSPGSPTGATRISGTCPTFLWGSVTSIQAYELVVYRVPAEDALPRGSELQAVLRISLPGTAQGWTPALGQCLEPGGQYAWTLRAVEDTGEPGAWSEANVFEISAAPSVTEIEEALLLLRQYLAGTETGGATSGPDSGSTRALETRSALRQQLEIGESETAGPAYITAETPVSLAPTLGAASLTLDGDIHLGSTSTIFRGDQLFLWSSQPDGFNFGFGKGALESNAGGLHNTALGMFALKNNLSGRNNTATGLAALILNTTGQFNVATGSHTLDANIEGDYNTASGASSLSANTSGDNNTATGHNALFNNTVGFQNTATGAKSLNTNVDGDANTAVGFKALYGSTSSTNTAVGSLALVGTTTGAGNVAVGFNAGSAITTGSYNIHIGAPGLFGDGNTIRIGTGIQTATYIAGIHGKSAGSGIGVFVNSSGKLGTATSSRRFKDDIRDMAESSERLLELRPVTFRYKKEVIGQQRRLEYGLIAEEVAEIFPELVAYGRDGKPYTVRYHLLGSLLLNELQKQQLSIRAQSRELRELQEQLGRLAGR